METSNNAIMLVPTESKHLTCISNERQKKLSKEAKSTVDKLLSINVHSPQFNSAITELSTSNLSVNGISENTSNRFLNKPTYAMGQEHSIGQSLIDLRRTVEALDDAHSGKPFSRYKIISRLPFIRTFRRHKDRYTSAQTHIGEILVKLSNGKQELVVDNSEIDNERAKLWNAIGILEERIYSTNKINEQIRQEIANETDPIKARALTENALFYTNQLLQDLVSQLAIAVQGYTTLDLIKKNNIELIKGVDRASSTTVAALRISVTTALALNSQKIVLDQINAVNESTSNMIKSTSEFLKTQTGRVHNQAVNSVIPIDLIKESFQNIYSTIDMIDSFKINSIASMERSINTISTEVDKARLFLENKG